MTGSAGPPPGAGTHVGPSSGGDPEGPAVDSGGAPEDGAGPGRRFVDLHLHSTASDGTLPPTEVVRRAAAVGLRGIALTDHDTVAGVEEAATEADRLGLDFLPAAELSANEPGREVHLLAYGVDPSDRELRAFLERYTGDRVRRARRMVSRLRSLGVPLEYAQVEAEAGDAAPTRAHVARALMAAGLIDDEEEAFRRWISRGKPAFVEKRPTRPAEVVERAHAAGGVVLLAHPGRRHGPERIRRWAAGGLDGVEIRHPANPPGVRRRLERLAGELGLLRGGGSDWHGPSTHRAELGAEEVPAAWMDAIAERCGARLRGSDGSR